MPIQGWRISPEGVQTVLTNVGAVAATLSGAVDGLPAKVETAVAATAGSPVIGDAIVGLFEHHTPTLEAIGNRIGAATGGAAAATMWYVTGDGEMATQQQQAAASAADGAATFTLPPGAQQ